MKETEKVAEELFDKIRSRFEDVSIGDESAKSTVVPEEARFFNFDFVVNGKNYGNITVSIADSNSLKVYYSRNISHEMLPEDRPRWYEFLKGLRFFAKRNMMMFDTRDISRQSLKLRDIKAVGKQDRAYTTQDLSMTESRMYGTRTRSFENLGPVKLLVKHSSPVNDEVRGARSRHIESVFVETAEGERFKLPFIHLTGARAMARHLQNGGSMSDHIGEHIKSLVEEMSNLRVFVRNTRGKVFEDADTNEMVESAIDYYGELHERLHKLKGSRTYARYVESYQPEELDTSDYNENEIKERFTRKMFDERMTSALNSVYKAYRRKQTKVPETAMGKQFEEWADSVVEAPIDTEFDVEEMQDFFSEPVILGPDAANAVPRVIKFIDEPGLNELLLAAATENPEDDARNVVFKWMKEHMPEELSKLDSGGVQEEVDRYDKQGDLISDITDEIKDDEISEDATLAELRRLAGL